MYRLDNNTVHRASHTQKQKINEIISFRGSVTLYQLGHYSDRALIAVFKCFRVVYYYVITLFEFDVKLRPKNADTLARIIIPN
jgi:hypothetical protein